MRPQETHNSFQMLMYCHHSRVLREFFHQPEMNETRWNETNEMRKIIKITQMNEWMNRLFFSLSRVYYYNEKQL